MFKTKYDLNSNIERYKARLIAKGYIQKDDTNYKETFSPVSKKDSLRISMTLVAHYDIELHQMDVKTTCPIEILRSKFIWINMKVSWLKKRDLWCAS